MYVLEISNNYSHLITKDYDLKTKLWQTLRFRQKNYYHSKSYRSGVWDGFVNFFDRKNGRFLTGLLAEVTYALNHLGIKYKTVDTRVQTKFCIDKVDDQFLNQWLPEGMEPITLEDYQVDFINQAIKHKRGTIKAPTSAGKSFILIGIMKALPPNTPIILTANRKSVIRQNYKEIIKFGFPNVGLFDGNHHDPNVITCSTVQSLHLLEKLLPKFKVLIVDEIHMMLNNTAVKMYRRLKGCDIRLGLSATPFKFGESDKVQMYGVKGFFGPVFKTKTTETGKLTTEFLQERGRLSESVCIFYPITQPKLPYDIYIDAVTHGIAQNIHFHKVVTKLAKGLKGRTLIIVERLAHGDTLNKMIPGSLWVQGKDNDETRDYVIEQLQKAKDDVVAIATGGIFNAAINVFVHNLINAAGGKAEHDIIQRVGRGLRTASDKKILNYYDFIFKINPYLDKHSDQRVRVLSKEKHEIIIKDKIDF